MYVLTTTKTWSEGQEDTVCVNFTRWLRRESNELLASVAAVEITTADLTITNVAVSTVEREIDEETAEIGTVLEFFLTGPESGNTYQIKATGVTNSTPARTLPVAIVIECT